MACFDSAADAESADSSLCKATRPATEEVCNTHQCTSSSYQLGVFDLRLLGAGGSKIDDIEERGSRFYQFDNSAASAAGVCIRGDVQPSFTQMCSVSTLTLASQCLSQTRACLVSQFPPPDFNSLTRGAATSKDCGCYTNAQVRGPLPMEWMFGRVKSCVRVDCMLTGFLRVHSPRAVLACSRTAWPGMCAQTPSAI